MIDSQFHDGTRGLCLVATLLVLLFLVSCVNGDEILVEPTPEATTAPVTPTDTRITPTGTPPTMPATTSGAAPISTQEIESPVTSLGHLLYTDLNGIAKIDLDTGEVTRLSEPVETDRVNGIRGAALSPDREWLAYWQTMGDVSTLNLLNVEDESLKVAMTLTDSNDWTPHLFWSADGLYLFVTLEPPPTPAVLGEPTRDYVGVRRYYLYSQETGEIELWNRDCDRIGFSPRTKRIAMWCPSVGEAETTYAVVEWGGEIWFTPEPPDTILKVRALEYSLPTWAWSDDGRQVVYPSQDRAISTTLVLATTHSGELTTEILGDGYSLSYVGLHWSADQRFIAFKGQCPTIAPCLLVLDLKTAEVVWTSESLGEINRNLADHFWHPSANLLLQPSFPGVYRIFVIDPLSQEIIRQIELGDARFGIGWLP